MTRLKDEARSADRLVDLTHGRKCRALLLLESGHVLLSVVHPDTLCKRFPTLPGGMDKLKKEV